MVSILVIDYPYRPGPYPIPAALAPLAAVGCFPSFIVWALGSIWHHFRVGGARMQAEALVEAQQRASLVPLGAVASGAYRATVPAGVLVCGVCCGAPATVRCIGHGVLLCRTCWYAHHERRHGAGMSSARSQQVILQPSVQPPKCS
jgi:hypothetical protein